MPDSAKSASPLIDTLDLTGKLAERLAHDDVIGFLELWDRKVPKTMGKDKLEELKETVRQRAETFGKERSQNVTSDQAATADCNKEEERESTSSSGSVVASLSHKVIVGELGFNPRTVRCQEGDIIVWEVSRECLTSQKLLVKMRRPPERRGTTTTATNSKSTSSTSHRIDSREGGVEVDESELLRPGMTHSWRCESAGRYTFSSEILPFMKGEIHAKKATTTERQCATTIEDVSSTASSSVVQTSHRKLGGNGVSDESTVMKEEEVRLTRTRERERTDDALHVMDLDYKDQNQRKENSHNNRISGKSGDGILHAEVSGIGMTKTGSAQKSISTVVNGKNTTWSKDRDDSSIGGGGGGGGANNCSRFGERRGPESLERASWRCVKCSRCFYSTVNLQRHRETHRKDTPKSPLLEQSHGSIERWWDAMPLEEASALLDMRYSSGVAGIIVPAIQKKLESKETAEASTPNSQHLIHLLGYALGAAKPSGGDLILTLKYCTESMLFGPRNVEMSDMTQDHNLGAALSLLLEERLEMGYLKSQEDSYTSVSPASGWRRDETIDIIPKIRKLQTKSSCRSSSQTCRSSQTCIEVQGENAGENIESLTPSIAEKLDLESKADLNVPKKTERRTKQDDNDTRRGQNDSKAPMLQRQQQQQKIKDPKMVMATNLKSSCTKCSRTFASKLNLTRHRATHRKDSPPTPLFGKSWDQIQSWWESLSKEEGCDVLRLENHAQMHTMMMSMQHRNVVGKQGRTDIVEFPERLQFLLHCALGTEKPPADRLLRILDECTESMLFGPITTFASENKCLWDTEASFALQLENQIKNAYVKAEKEKRDIITSKLEADIEEERREELVRERKRENAREKKRERRRRKKKNAKLHNDRDGKGIQVPEENAREFDESAATEEVTEETPDYMVDGSDTRPTSASNEGMRATAFIAEPRIATSIQPLHVHDPTSAGKSKRGYEVVYLPRSNTSDYVTSGFDAPYARRELRRRWKKCVQLTASHSAHSCS